MVSARFTHDGWNFSGRYFHENAPAARRVVWLAPEQIEMNDKGELGVLSDSGWHSGGGEPGECRAFERAHCIGAPLLRTPWADGAWDLAGGWLRVELAAAAPTSGKLASGQGDEPLAITYVSPRRREVYEEESGEVSEAGGEEAGGEANAAACEAPPSANLLVVRRDSSELEAGLGGVDASWRQGVLAHVTRKGGPLPPVGGSGGLERAKAAEPRPTPGAWPLLVSLPATRRTRLAWAVNGSVFVAGYFWLSFLVLASAPLDPSQSVEWVASVARTYTYSLMQSWLLIDAIKIGIGTALSSEAALMLLQREPAAAPEELPSAASHPGQWLHAQSARQLASMRSLLQASGSGRGVSGKDGGEREAAGADGVRGLAPLRLFARAALGTVSALVG